MKMHNLLKPQISFENHYRNCVDGKNEPKRTELLNILPDVLIAAENYNRLADNSNLYQIQPTNFRSTSGIQKNDLIKLYEEKMLPANSAGRHIYNQLLLIAQRCPFCSHGEPKSLDHFLPKNYFSEFSILPLNLIPSCKDCNHRKRDIITNIQTEQFMHPYYDNFSTVQWLEADISFSIGNAPTFIFRINPSAFRNIRSDYFPRMSHQFRELGLNELYSKLAGDELAGIYFYLKGLHSDGGDTEVSEYLSERATSWTIKNKNCWNAAMYRSTALDQRFHSMNWDI